MPRGWITCLGVDDVDGKANDARRLGATILAGPADVAALGRLGILADPTGVTFGLCRGSV